MSEHKSNPDAVLRAMLPPALPAGCRATGLLVTKVVPAAGVLPYPREHMRKIEAGGFEMQKFPSEEWIPAPEGVRLHPIGDPLPPELCDIVVMVGTEVEDTLAGGIIAPGRPAHPRRSVFMHGELVRVPLVPWQEAHMGQLRGQVT